MKTVLVVGGAGYIGSHMVLALLDAGYQVVVFDNLSRGHADAVGAAPLFVGDLRSLSDLDACFTQHRPDLVMHFAALAYVGESVRDPGVYYQNNVTGALNLLEMMRLHNVGRIVFSSTCATYGEPEQMPIAEGHPRQPVNPYGRTKLMIEQALEDYGQAYGIRSISLRYFNAAGADLQCRAGERHDPETHLIPLVLAEAMRLQAGGRPEQTELQVYGADFPTRDGSCVRDYIHVSDLCSAHLLAARRLLEGPALCNTEAFNLANGIGFSVLEIIETCRRVTGQPVQYQVAPRRPGDPPVLVGDAAKAARVLGWTPRFTSVEEIIHTAWTYMSRSLCLR